MVKFRYTEERGCSKVKTGDGWGWVKIWCGYGWGKSVGGSLVSALNCGGILKNMWLNYCHEMRHAARSSLQIMRVNRKSSHSRQNLFLAQAQANIC